MCRSVRKGDVGYWQRKEMQSYPDREDNSDDPDLPPFSTHLREPVGKQP